MVVISTIVILKNHLYALSIVVKNRLLAQQNFQNEINEKDKFLKICFPSYIFFKEDTKVWGKKRDTFKNQPLIRNPQFLSYPHETWWKWLPHEVIIFTKFHEDRTKIVGFLLMANFWKGFSYFRSTLYKSFHSLILVKRF